MTNQKFRQSEQAILVAYFKLRDYPNAKKIATRAKISRATFYRHHQSPQSIPYNYEKYLLKIYKRKMKLFLTEKRINIKIVFIRALVFIYANKEIIRILIEDGRTSVIDEIVAHLKDQIVLEWGSSNKHNDLFKVYKKEVTGIIELWAEEDFNDKKLDIILKKVLFLTKTAPKRLEFLTD